MEIFISYRRGGSDQAHAGRIHDYLETLGYQSFYDRDETVNEIGAPFPETLRRALAHCRALIAVVGESWLMQAGRLANVRDWVRHELLSGTPPTTLHLIPIFFPTPTSSELNVALPMELEFVREANRFTWRGFDNAEKHLLLEELRRVLPEIQPKKQVTNYDRLELLCDRVRAAGTFDSAVSDWTQPRRPACWMLFGEQNEGQAAIFERIEAYALTSEHYTTLYPVHRMVDLSLHEYRGYPGEEIREHIVRTAGGGAAKSYRDLYAVLSRKKIQLCVLYSVVHVETVAEARWWTEFVQQLRQDLPTLSDTDPQIVVALSISYSERKRTFPLNLLRRRAKLEQFFRDQYAHLFHDGENTPAADARPVRSEIRVSRLESASKDHVRLWCENRYVKPRITGLASEDFLAPFEKAPVRAMEHVLSSLQNVLNHRARV